MPTGNGVTNPLTAPSGESGSGPRDFDRRTCPRRLDDGLGDDDGGHALLEGDDVRLLAQHGVAELLVLAPQRLRLGDRVAHHVALGDTTELTDVVPARLHVTVSGAGKVVRQRGGTSR